MLAWYAELHIESLLTETWQDHNHEIDTVKNSLSAIAMQWVGGKVAKQYRDFLEEGSTVSLDLVKSLLFLITIHLKANTRLKMQSRSKLYVWIISFSLMFLEIVWKTVG